MKQGIFRTEQALAEQGIAAALEWRGGVKNQRESHDGCGLQANPIASIALTGGGSTVVGDRSNFFGRGGTMGGQSVLFALPAARALPAPRGSDIGPTPWSVVTIIWHIVSVIRPVRSVVRDRPNIGSPAR